MRKREVARITLKIHKLCLIPRVGPGLPPRNPDAICSARCVAHAHRCAQPLLEFNTRSCSSCSGWPSQSCWQASRLSLERRPHPCSRCRARPAAAVAVCVSALISGVAAVSTCKARHKALSRLADAGVKRMAAHDGRDVHASAQPAVQTTLDSDA